MAREHITQYADVEPQADLRGLDITHRSEHIPAVCFVRDVARILRISESRVYQLHRERKLRNFELHQIDSKLRFNGLLLKAWREGKFEPKPLRLRKA